MNIGIDIDGVIADGDPVFRKYILKLFGKYLPREAVNSYYYEDVFGLSLEQIEQLWRIFTEEDGWSSLPVIEDAQETIARLAIDNMIYLVTARPLNVREKTVEWLKKNNIKYSCLIFSKQYKNKYDSLLANKLHLDYLIEDKLENAIEIAENDIKVLLIDYPWNKMDKLPSGVKRILNWKEALEIIDSSK